MIAISTKFRSHLLPIKDFQKTTLSQEITKRYGLWGLISRGLQVEKHMEDMLCTQSALFDVFVARILGQLL